MGQGQDWNLRLIYVSPRTSSERLSLVESVELSSPKNCFQKLEPCCLLPPLGLFLLLVDDVVSSLATGFLNVIA